MSRPIDLYYQYIDDVKSGTTPAGQRVHDTIDRQLHDLSRSSSEAFPFYFDEDYANHILDLTLGTRMTSDVYAGKPFDLQPWQAFIRACEYGWRRQDNGCRRYRESSVMVPRKNGKTEFKAFDLVYGVALNRVMRTQSYAVASKKDQANAVYDAAVAILEYMSKESTYLGRALKFEYGRVYNQHTQGFLKSLAREHKGSYDGKKGYAVVIDEYHAHPNSEAYESMKSSGANSPNSFLTSISTCGFNRHSSPLWEMQQMVEKVIKGTMVDDSIFGMIYAMDEGDDPKDPMTHRKCNPNYGVSIDPYYFESLANQAFNAGGIKLISFMVKHLNSWADGVATWISSDVIRSRIADFTLEDMRGRDCFMALDLATIYDLNALSLFFPRRHAGEKHRVITYSFIGEESMAERVRRDHVDYYRWVDEDWIIATPGVSTDYEYIRQKVNEVSQVVNVIEVAYDRFNAYEIIGNLISDGFKCQGFGQGFSSMTNPTKGLDKLYREGEIERQGNPVQAWAFSNVVLKIDAAGNYKPDKEKSKEKIDPVVAEIMAYGQYLDWLRRNEDYGIGGISVV